MKRIGIISYVNHSGLGVIAASFRKHLSLDSQFIIKHPIKDAPDETYDIGILHTFGDFEPTIDQFNKYLDKCKPEVVIVVETPFNFEFFKIMHDRGIKVVLIPMIDSIEVARFIPYEKYIDLVINFTKVGQEFYTARWPGESINGINIPYPIDTNYFNPKEAKKRFNCPPNTLAAVGEDLLKGPEVEEYFQKTWFTFIHSQGWGGAGFRKSTDLVSTAFVQLSHTNKNISLRINSQPGEHQHSQIRPPKGMTFIYSKDLPEAIDLYRGGKIYVAPSRREGLGLPILEAMACGLPVITTDAPPMNEWFPKDYPLLMKVQCQTDLPYGDIPMYTPNAYDLMQKMEFAYKNLEKMEQIGKNNCNIIKEKFSWNVLRDTYLEVLNR